MESDASNQVNAIVNNLSAKIGVAVDKLIPVANTLSNELYTSNLVYGIFLAIIALAISVVAFILFAKASKMRGSASCYNDDCCAILCVSVVCLVAAFIVFIVSAYCISNCFQPTVLLLEKISVLN